MYGGICDSSACHVYIMWVEFCNSHFSLGKHKVGGFMCQPFLKSNNKQLETGIKMFCSNNSKQALKMVLKGSMCIGFCLILSSDNGATTVPKIILFFMCLLYVGAGTGQYRLP